VRKRTDSPGSGSLTSAALTALSTLLVTAFAAVVGVIMAREFGRTEETDGFFAAYGVFVVIVLAGIGAVLASAAIGPTAGRARAVACAVATAVLAVAGVVLTIAVELAIALSSLLRRSVLVRFPDKKAAALHGDAWFELLCADERTAQGDPTERTAPVGAAGPRPIHVVRELTETVYAGGRANIHADEWIAFVRGWIGAAA